MTAVNEMNIIALGGPDMRIFTVIAAAAALLVSVAVAYAHEPPEWTSDVKEDGGPPAWIDDVKTDGGPPAFVETAGGRSDQDSTDEDRTVDEDAATVEETNESASGEAHANVPEWVAEVRADGGPPAWVEDVRAGGGPPVWVAEVRTTPAAATAAIQKKAGR